jgi:hypothetical protein
MRVCAYAYMSVCVSVCRRVCLSVCRCLSCSCLARDRARVWDSLVTVG